MAVSELETKQKELMERFSAPLPEYYKRRIIFWHDEERQYEELIDELELPGVKIAKLNGKNTFWVKKLLCSDDTDSDYLVYDPLTFEKPDDDWLLNLKLYNEEYRSDRLSNWISDFGLPDSPAFRNKIKSYKDFFGRRERREAFKKLNERGQVNSPDKADLAVMSVICKTADIRLGRIVFAVITAGADTDENSLYQQLVKYGADKAFENMLARAAGFRAEEFDVGALTDHLLLTAACKTMSTGQLASVRQHFNESYAANCYDLVSDWLHSDSRERLYDHICYTENKLDLYELFSELEISDIEGTEIFPCIDEVILTKFMTDIAENVIQAEKIKSVIEKRRTFVWYDRFANYYDCIMQVANMQDFYVKHSTGFHTVEPHKIWNEYTSDYYFMDSCYRLYHLAFQRSLQSSEPLLDDLCKRVTERVEGLYSHWFLGELGQNWCKAAAEQLEQYGRILEVPQQTDFYKNKVAKHDTRLYVIISDAFRYEAAVSLTHQLKREINCQAELKSMSAVFPTITKYGMAALLPHEKLTVDENMKVYADGIPTDSGYREKILQKADPASVVLKADDLLGNMKQADRFAAVKGMNVVYIYHNRIDKTSHASETDVFSACDEAVKEIKRIIKLFTNDAGSSGVSFIITADHGFLYTFSPLSESAKADKTTPADQDIEIDRRYIITKGGENTEYLLPVKFIGNENGYEAWTPSESIRIKKKGGGLNFVHGGISLQEMIVPVIEYRSIPTSSKEFKRNKDKIQTKPVTLTLISSGRKISNMLFTLSFYQKEPVRDNCVAVNYLLFFTDSNDKKVSDVQKVIADKTSTNDPERTFKCSFNLRSQKFNSSDIYFLNIIDESGKVKPVKEEFYIDIPFAMDEFDFF